MHLTSPQLLPAAGRSAHKVYRVGRGNRDMTIRNAEVGDLDAIADLAQDQRLRQQAWAPKFWALAPNAREVHPLFLRVTLGSGRSISLVASVAGSARIRRSLPLTGFVCGGQPSRLSVTRSTPLSVCTGWSTGSGVD